MEQVTFERVGFGKRLTRMLKVDIRRVLRSRLFYIIIACALLLPILMTVMMNMMDGSVSTNPETGEETVMEGPENTWQNIGTLPTAEPLGGSDIFAMCNINMAFMGVCAFVCIFISADFRSGYAKNLFAVRAGKSEYVISKTLMGFLCGALMLVAYLIGSVIGGAIAQLSFGLCGLSPVNLIMCILAKIFLMPVFVSIFTLVSILFKERTWLSICLSLGGGMLLFMTVSLITPLNATYIHALVCLGVGLLVALGLGAVSTLILKKTRLV